MKEFNFKQSGRGQLARFYPVLLTDFRFAALAFALLMASATGPRVTSQAQRMYAPNKVSAVTAEVSANKSFVTISGDGALNRPQTWQDEEGFHIVLPNTVSSDAVKVPRGVKLRRVGSSLEILAQTKPGSRVTVNSGQNQINLTVDGKLEARRTDSTFNVVSTSPEERQLFQDSPSARSANDPAVQNFTAPVVNSNSTSTSVETPSAPLATTAATPAAPAQTSTDTGSSAIVAQGDDSVAPAPTMTVHAEDESVLASVFSGTSVFIVFALGLFGLLVSRKLRSKHNSTTTKVDVKDDFEDVVSSEPAGSATASQASSQALVRTGDASATKTSKPAVARMPVAGPTSLYGAYRIDQEVGKLVLGQPHRIDVLASRAIDDRRAIETSLIKVINAPAADEKSQSRARGALEEYGFVARQCAALLMAPDAFERSSAARALGEMKSAAALPFLLEGLYDSESIVRNQAVVSIGELRLPSAIGALLDIARTHPDVPSSLLSRTLSACSVEGLDFFDAVVAEPSQLGPGDIGSVIQEITHLEASEPVENLPAGSDDDRFVEALTSIESDDVEKRAEALKTLVQFRVQASVDAIARVARHDPEGAIRSLAISSLGSISHESVFATVLIGMADDSREVRAAAARSVNRLNFDRADAYVRVIETSDDDTLQAVARACVQAGIVSQNLDRLSNADHRQAYETFALICLLTKAGMNQTVLDAISDHPRTDVRLKAVHLLGATGHPSVVAQLRELAVKDNIGELVKTGLLEALYRLDQNKAADEELTDEFVVEHHSDCANDSDNIADLVAPDFEPDMPSGFELSAHIEADEFER